MQPLLIQGLVAATFTPMHDDGKLNLPLISEVVDYLIERRIAGLYILGSTGEGLSLTHDERKQVAEAFVEAAGSRLPVIVQVGCESLMAAADLAAHAEAIGANAISAVSPVYFKPESARGLVLSMQQIASAAPRVPFYYYHIPAATGLRHSILDFVEIASKQVPNFCGIKFTSPELYDFQACLETQKAELLWGVDEMLLGGVSAGAHGAVGSTYNFAAKLYHEMLTALDKGNLAEARACQSQSQEIVRAFVPFGPRAAQKAMFSMVGPDCGPPRLPICRLSQEDHVGLTAALKQTRFFELQS
ncbi:MAG: N-acetylneuraminate lyase [Aureliella sp.]